jgi:hypothetical protein
MTPTEIDQRLAERGIRYDVGDEPFYDGIRPLDPDEVNALLPELSDDEIVSYQDAKWDAAKAELWRA